MHKPTIDAVVAVLLARADSLEVNGNPMGAYECRSCALAVERLAGRPVA